MMRRLLAAALFFALSVPALAQSPYPPGPPPAVPALPDNARQTTYTISGTTCACAVNFQLYQDGTDIDSWIQVWVNGKQYLSTDPTFGWSIASVTGGLATIPRPITNAVLTFNNAQTGTVVIVGAQRPRRLTEFTEGQGIPARAHNQALNALTAIERELWDKTNDLTGRGFFFPPGNTAGPMPAPSACANSILGFDVTGYNPKCLTIAPGNGNVVGTSPTVNGNLASWGNTSATLIGDSGVSASAVQQLLTGINSVYIAPASGSTHVGSDSNSCLDINHPCLTATHALAVLRPIHNPNSNGFLLVDDTCSPSPCQYTESVNIDYAYHSALVLQSLNGNTSNVQWNCTNTFTTAYCFYGKDGSIVTIQNITMVGFAGGATQFIKCANHETIDVKNVNFITGASNQDVLEQADFAFCETGVDGTINITAGAGSTGGSSLFAVQRDSYLSINSATINFTNAQTWSGGVIQVVGGTFENTAATFTNKGNFTGSQGLCENGSRVFFSAGTPFSVLPGSPAFNAEFGCNINGSEATTNILVQALPADPHSTGQTSGAMMGLGSAAAPCVITTNTGQVRVRIAGNMANDTANDGVKVFLRMGTGTPPTNAAGTTAPTGTILGSTNGRGYNPVPSNGAFAPFGLDWVATVTPNVATWFDVQVNAVTGGNASISNVACQLEEK